MTRRYVPHEVRVGPWPTQEAVPECTPSFTLEEYIASLRDGDPKRWAELQAEWSQ